jgi:hypothetical protein
MFHVCIFVTTIAGYSLLSSRFHPEDSDSIIDLGMTTPYQLVSMSIELHQVVAGISIWTSVLSDFSHLMFSPLKLRF